MPWKQSSTMSQRQEFVILANVDKANVRQLCRRFGISPTTGYKWLGRYQADGPLGLKDHSRRPKSSPIRTSAKVEQAVVQLRKQHPAWGGRKLQARLRRLTNSEAPCPSTITAILHRHQLITPEAATQHRPYQRFEHPNPNDLWQMDFKGDFALEKGRCHALSVLDDHSRFALGLVACGDQTTSTVQKALTEIFRRYGMPYRMSMDNGSPWAGFTRGKRHWTQLSVWFLRLGIRLSFARPHHPQTNGKDERFHRTLKLELLRDHIWRNLGECQPAFVAWREIYNCERPHEALGLDVPASRYQISPRSFPERLPPIEYPDDATVRKVERGGMITLQNRGYFVGEAFRGLHVALRLTTVDGRLDVYFLHQKVASLDLRSAANDHLSD
jgi:transposase InsO family protein